MFAIHSTICTEHILCPRHSSRYKYVTLSKIKKEGTAMKIKELGGLGLRLGKCSLIQGNQRRPL